MPGDVPDPVLVEARRALLDALEALSGHLDHIVLAYRLLHLPTADLVGGMRRLLCG